MVKSVAIFLTFSLLGCDSYQGRLRGPITPVPQDAKKTCYVEYETHQHICWQPIYQLIENRGLGDLVVRIGWPIVSGPHKDMFLICNSNPPRYIYYNHKDDISISPYQQPCRQGEE